MPTATRRGRQPCCWCDCECVRAPLCCVSCSSFACSAVTSCASDLHSEIDQFRESMQLYWGIDLIATTGVGRRRRPSRGRRRHTRAGRWCCLSLLGRGAVDAHHDCVVALVRLQRQLLEGLQALQSARVTVVTGMMMARMTASWWCRRGMQCRRHAAGGVCSLHHRHHHSATQPLGSRPSDQTSRTSVSASRAGFLRPPAGLTASESSFVTRPPPPTTATTTRRRACPHHHADHDHDGHHSPPR